MKLLKDNNSVKYRVFTGLFWNICGLIFNKGFAMISSIIVARVLGTAMYGEYGMLNSTISMFATFAGLGLGVTATKFIAEFRQTNKEKVERVLGLTNLFAIVSGFLMAVIVFFISDWISINQLNNSSLAPLLKISSIMLLINTYNGVQRGALSGFEKFSILAKIDAIVGAFTCIVVVFGTIKFGLYGLIISNVLVNLLSVILCHFSFKSCLAEEHLNINYKDFRQELRVFLEISLPSLLTGIMVGPVTWVANTMFIQIPNGYGELGIFNAANQWKQLLQLLPSTFNMALLPILIATKNDNSEYMEKINMVLSWVVVILIGLPIINLPDIISYFYGAQYSTINYDICIVINVLTTIVLAYKEGMSRSMLSEGHMWRGVVDNCIWAISLLLLTFCLRKYGALGYSIAFLLSYTITAIIFIPYNIYKGTIKRKYIFNSWICMVWFVVLIETAITVFQFQLYIRVLVFVINVIVYLICFFYLIKSKKKKERQ